MKQREQALILFQKGLEDLIAAEVILPMARVTDAIVGFHCQQAAEKFFKAVLSNSAIPYRKTHDLEELIDLLTDHGAGPPNELRAVTSLTPFAAELRYDPIPPEGPEPFDRAAALDLVKRLRVWAEGIVRP